ncbi:AMP-binding protein [Geomicrobium sediminis]|uniref:Acyl-CoA synthetase (AMP-forming)/AMP-acid ligase II n=1 Tax=Geomicrobium sediminis TaxID=1347788 RepID=A0ABS2P7K3_9BACL|nr:AMP-binding protein [Geomicrobium sediminis]MBM7631387.1 acyl-CoA synthetase (AMP-forming)/AMP-acid ligase II [Geomicrobium sediminis]
MDEQHYLDDLRKRREVNWPKHLPKEAYYPFGKKFLTDYLEEHAHRTPNKASTIFYGRELTFAELNEKSSRFATYLSEIGIKKGDRIAVYMPNCPQFIIAFYAILKIGAIHVPVNPMFKEKELHYELTDCDAQVIVTLDQFLPLINQVKDRTTLHTIIATSLSDYLPENPTLPIPDGMTQKVQHTEIDFEQVIASSSSTYPHVDRSLDDIAALNYTGGTTGLPKGCMHTQGDMVYTAATSTTFGLSHKGDQVTLNYLPIFWIAGEDAGVINPIFTGHTQVLMTRWDTETFIQAVEKYRITSTSAITDNLVAVMNEAEGRDLSSFKTTLGVSFVKKINVEYRKRWYELTGTVLKEASYGMTETHTMDSFTDGQQEQDADLDRPGFVGFPMPGTEIKILDFDTGALLPIGTEGEIAIRTPSLMKGYWNNEEKTAQDLVDGWLKTGDIGLINEKGQFYFLGRKKEMLKVNGMSVFPAEIEVIVTNHAGVAVCGVIGIEDEQKGELPVAAVVLEKETTVQELEAYCKENMASYKRPRIVIMKSVPMTATGKVKKPELKEEIEHGNLLA